MGYTSGRVGPLPEMYTLIGGDAEGFQKQFTAFSQEYLGLYCAYKKVLSTGKEEGENKKTVRARKVYQIGWPLSAVASEVRVLFFVFIIILKRDKNVNLINLTYLVKILLVHQDLLCFFRVLKQPTYEFLRPTQCHRCSCAWHHQ